MVDVRSPKWREEKDLSDIEADRRIDEAFRVVQSMGSLYLVTSRLDEKVFRRVFSKFKIQAPKKKSFLAEPDFICFIAFATVALTYVSRNFPETEKVDFVIEKNGKMTSHIKEFYSVMGECFLDPSLRKFLGDLILGGKDMVPLQAADVVCWHDRRHEAGLLSPLDAVRYGKLSRMQGFRHEWTNEELANRLAGFRSSFPKPGP